ncbi:MAG: serine/threonine-protein kinase [Cyanobacteria bacterium P01_F01_bin.13]
MRADGGIDGFAALLGKAGLELGAEEMADVLWLAGHICSEGREQVVKEEDIETKPAAPTVREEYLDSEPEDDEDDAQLSLSLPQKQNGTESSSAKPDGIPIKAPAAPALRIRLELARALRPLRRRVPSPVRVEFDQAATIDRIADQGIWSPVLSPAPERWLKVALVIEESKSAPLWKETLAEFQTLLERQGAFRSVSSWRLRSDEKGKLTLLSGRSNRPRSARELLDPAGRRLILVVSDCTSAAWQKGAIYPWLEIWGAQAPMTVIQLLSERLWAQTGLAYGVPMWLSSLEPGVPSARMMATTQMPLWDLFGTEQEQVTVPVVSLEAEPLKQWARVVTGAGEIRTVGFRFEKRGLAPSAVEGGEEQPEISTDERVRLFRATASLIAQKLARLMSAAPVSPPIVNLIRQTMLPEAEPVHVAEVYMSGLMQSQENNVNSPEVVWDFIPEVRDLLLDTISIPDTEKILDTVSRYISERIGLSIHSFETLLGIDFEGYENAQRLFLPFARVTKQTLERIGGSYAAMANQIQTIDKVIYSATASEELNTLFPLLMTYKFREAQVTFQVLQAPDEDEILGTLLTDRYRIMKILGSGSFGDTYLAKDIQRSGEPDCVIKQLRIISDNPKVHRLARRLFAAEAATLERLGGYDRIPRLLAYFESDYSFYLVQEKIEGRTLKELLEPRQPMSQKFVAQLLLDMLPLLATIHSQGVIHRDIKPSNIIHRNSDNRYVLIDFGAVKQISNRLTDTNARITSTVGIGTQGYMPSEQAAGLPNFSSDLHALGVTAIEALTGLSSWDLKRDSHGEFIWTDKVPDLDLGLTTVLEKMVRFDFNQRYSNARLALEQLQKLVDLELLSEEAPEKKVSAQNRDEFDITLIPTNGIYEEEG